MSNYYDDTPDMVPVSEIEPIARELTERRLSDWRRKAVEQYPNIQSLVDLVQGNSEESVMDTARDMSERLSSSGNPGVATPTTYVPGGAVALPPAPNDQEEMEDLKRRARAGDEQAGVEALYRLRERASRGR